MWAGFAVTLYFFVFKHISILYNMPILTCHISHLKRLRQAAIIGVCVCMQLSLLLSVSNLLLAPAAHAQSIFSWFSKNDNNTPNALFDEPPASLPLDKSKLDQSAKHQAAFGELVYHYFQEDYQQVLKLVEVGHSQHGFTHLSKEDTDRLNLIQGAAQLKLGLYTLSQAKFARLLSQTTSDYVQANTWFFMAKAGFENKQAYLSEKAYQAVMQGQLQQELKREQFVELLYITAHTRMHLNQDWQSLATQIPNDNIYSAYLLANYAAVLFNQGNYEQASGAFTEAKQALVAYQNRSTIIARVASSVFDSVSWFVTPWTWFDSNANAQQVAKERAQLQVIEEQDALFDRINMGLGLSLLQTGDLPNAIAVIQNIANNGAQSQQALLSYGWANAKENRWQTAMAAWQHLQQNSVGLFSLQASYGLAYAFGQQDNLGQAFFALQRTARQIDESLSALDSFSVSARRDTFFNQYNDQWPQALDDLKLGFFAANQDFDATYLLTMRSQAEQIKSDIDNKKQRVVQLTTLLQEREAVYQARLKDMSLQLAEARIQQAQQYVNKLNEVIATATTFEKQLALAKQMSSANTRAHLVRLEDATLRHERLLADTSAKRPISEKYQDRLRRIEGILTWQLMDDFVAQQWTHKQLLANAQISLSEAQKQYNNLQSIAQNKEIFRQQHSQFWALQVALNEQVEAADKVYLNATARLTGHLLGLIKDRKAQLQSQSVNTRLAMLRIQDLQQQGAK